MSERPKEKLSYPEASMTKTLTRSRNVNSIDAWLNEDHFEPISYVNGNGMWETLTGFLGPKSNKNNQTIEWQSKIPNISGRQRRADVIRSPVLSLRGPARSVPTYLDCFNMFFDKLMFDRVVEKTDLHINRYLIYNSTSNMQLKAINIRG